MDQRWAELARTLRGLGLWRHLPDDEAAAAERWVADGRYPFVSVSDDPGHPRRFSVDGESMAEGGVARELGRMAPSLGELGVGLRIEEVSFPARVEEGDYVVTIDGRRCVVWTPADWAEKRAWRVATVRPLATVNDLLAEAGATPRLFTLYAGGNDGFAWLLDPRVVEAVAGSGLLGGDEVPALATHD